MKENHLALMIRESAALFGERTAMRYKSKGSWKSVSYAELYETIVSVAKALIELDLKEGEKVGIFSQNRPEWAMADFGILSAGAVSVPIYATNTDKQAEYIVDDAGITVLFVGNREQYEKAKTFADSSKTLKQIISFDDDFSIDRDDSQAFGELCRKGRVSSQNEELQGRLGRVSTGELATVIYTSGTTGDPKGAMLTHSNFFHQFNAVDTNFTVTEEDRSLCFLPLSHVYERIWSYYVFSKGAENNYLSDPKKVIEYLQDVKPTAMVSVPRLYEKIYSTVFDKLEKASPSKKKLFLWALSVGKEYEYNRKGEKAVGLVGLTKHRIADRLVLRKIRSVVGGSKNFFSAGGAPLSKDIEEFFFASGLLICQGYGLTETSPMISYNNPNAFKFGTVGRPVPRCEVKIGERGEIMARGPNIMKGYYNKPNETAEAFEEGWFKTGDVGEIDEEGYLKITDRIKDLIITSGGKNIAPQRIETIIGKDHYIEQIAVIGDRRKYISALIIPAFEALESYARENNIDYTSRSELVNHPEIIEFYKERIERESKELATYEKIKAFTLLDHEFEQESGELTPTLKIKRKIVAEKYKDIIDKMYQ